MLNSGKNWRFFLSRVTLKFDGWPWKIIGHLFYTTLSFVQHFKAIGIFKVGLQSRNAQFGSKLVIFLPRWLWKLKYDLDKQQGTSPKLHQALCIISNPLVKSNLSYSLETLKSGKNWWFFVPRNLENWRMILKNNRAPLHLSYAASTFVHYSIANGEFKLELQSGNA